MPVLEMASGAGHDALTFAGLGVPTAMLFIRNEHGSHNPEEAMDDGRLRRGAGRTLGGDRRDRRLTLRAMLELCSRAPRPRSGSTPRRIRPDVTVAAVAEARQHHACRRRRARLASSSGGTAEITALNLRPSQSGLPARQASEVASLIWAKSHICRSSP